MNESNGSPRQRAMLAVTAAYGQIKSLLSESAVMSAANRMKNSASRAWGGSGVVGFFKTEHMNAEGSVLMRAVYSPFTFIDFLRDKLGATVRRAVSESFFVAAGAEYMDAFFSLDAAFFGVMALIFGVFNAVFAAVSGNLFAGVGSVLFPLAFVGAGCALLFSPWEPIAKRRGKITARREIFALIAGAVGGALSCYSALYGIAVPVAAAAAVLVLTSPELGVYLVIFAAPLIQSSLPIAIICLLTFFSLAVKGITGERKISWLRDGTGCAVAALITVLFVSSVFSFSPASSLSSWLMLFAFSTFYFSFVNIIRTPSDFRFAVWAFAASGAVVSLYGVIQYVFGGGVGETSWIDVTMFEGDTVRVYSTFANPNVFGEYLLLLIPVTAALFLTEKKSKYRRALWGVSLILSAASVVFTQSRGCWVGIIIAAALFITFYEGRVWTAAPLLILALFLVMPDTVLTRLSSIGNTSDTSTAYRVYIWLGTLDMLRYYFLGGVGLGEGAFGIAYPYFSYSGIDAPHSHSTYLQLVCDGGIPALLAFSALTLSFFKNVTFSYGAGGKRSFYSVMSLALGAGMLGFAVEGFFDYTFYNYRVAAIFFLYVGFSSAIRHMTGGGQNE
ncbi:MAG: O-antigen ligase family protein [Clostridiales bacterium]|nr:O-antigen ligase family protein [Clostridiales bacterium]